MSCSSCGTVGRIGHFGRMGAYVKASPEQIFTTTGPVISAPNETAGMHINRLSPRMQGLGDYFGPTQTRLIDGVDNEYLAIGAGLLLVFALMR